MVSTSGRVDTKQVAWLNSRAIERAGRQLHDGKPTPRRRHAPRPHRAPHLEDAPVSRHERDVDRKAHEEGMDRVGRRDDERASLFQEIAFQ